MRIAIMVLCLSDRLPISPGPIPARGASSRTCCGPGVIELEALRPCIRSGQGASVERQEAWEVYPEGQWPREIGDYYRELAA